MQSNPLQDRLDWELCARDAHAFIFGEKADTGTRHFVVTKDEHNIQAPVGPFPDDSYLRAILDLFLVSGGWIPPIEAVYARHWGANRQQLEHLADTRMLCIEKSRQLMITWIALAYTLWRAKFHEHQLCLVQSKREDDAQKLVCVKRGESDAARLTFMESHLPEHMRSRISDMKCNVHFSDKGSHVWGIPEGGSIIRSHTPSLLISDEAAFQPSFEEAYRAALPAVHGGGQGVFISSAEVGFFQELVEADDSKMLHEAETQKKESIKPLSFRVTKSGMFVARLHYAADPKKDPRRPAGKEWLRKQLQGYSGGTANIRWQKEMELLYTVGGGDRVFPEWKQWRRESRIIIPAEPSLEGATLWGSYDHGYSNPACYLVHAIYEDGMRRTIWEFYDTQIGVPYLAKIIKGETVKLPDGRELAGNPYAGREVSMIADPEIDRRTQQYYSGEAKSVAELFRMHGVYFIMGAKGDDSTVATWLKDELWADPMSPGYQITENCRALIWELGQLTRKEYSPQVARSRNNPEQLVDKDNHAWDALKYWMKQFPVGVNAKPVKKDTTETFLWWMNQTKRAKKGAITRSFRRDLVKR